MRFYKMSFDNKFIKTFCIIISVVLMFVYTVNFNVVASFAKDISADNGTYTVTSDADYLYISYNGAWSNYMGNDFYVSYDNSYNQQYNRIRLNYSNNGESGSFVVYDAYSNVISGSAGTVTSSNPGQYYGYENMQWSIKVPLSTYSDQGIESIAISVGGTNVDIKTVEKTEEVTEEKTEEVTEEKSEEATEEKTEEVTEEKSEEVTEEKTEEVTEEKSEEATEEKSEEATEEKSEEVTEEKSEEVTEENSEEQDIIITKGIVIDGYYGDWNDIPKTNITYNSDNSDCNHYGQLSTDGTTLYAHFKANTLYNTTMQIALWNITVNGQKHHLQIQAEKNGNIDWNKQIPTSEGTHTDLKVFLDHGNDNELNSKVAFTIYDSSHSPGCNGDEIEFSIDLRKLAELLGIDADQLGTITIQNDNLGQQGITIAGTSSGPWGGLALCLGSVGAVVFFTRRKREDEIDTKKDGAN